ncbi:MAG: OmcA/MtrC family decaheme c-type cytochrome [Acidobacteria bacterium]|nr:OmcA/MtrC family decaheme c-type cytochrome [Acidobacteriota bacterium]
MRDLRRPSKVALGLLTLLGAAFLIAGTSTSRFAAHDKAYYADPALVNFVRPGLVLKIVSAEIAADGSTRVQFKLTDPRGLPLDREGITTPGSVSVSFVAATIPNDKTQYTAYTTRVVTSPITRVTATQPGTDSGGTFEKLAEGEYIYRFATRAPSGFDRAATHSIGAYASRNLSEFDLGTQYDNDVFTFVPNGSKVTVVRDVVRTATCNKRCHDPLAAHGSRRKVELCVLCHQPQNMDPDTGNSVDFPVLIHKIHRGSDLPSVKAGKPFQIIGFSQNVFDFSDVVFPAGVRNCQVCHDPDSGAAQANAWLKPTRAACGACHDDVNFATGQGHVDLPQVSEALCSNCHIPQGELEFDASIKGAHLDPRFSADLPGTVFEILEVADGVAGKRPTVAFSLKDKAGKPIPPSTMGRLALALGGPTLEYAAYSYEDVRQAQGSGDGRYHWTFQAAIPPTAKGSYSVGIEGFRNIKVLEGTKKEQTVRDPGVNKIVYFSVDGTKIAPRRAIVSIDKCNACHLQLEMHSRSRNRIEHCVQCHNPNQTDAGGRPASQAPAQGINLRVMIHSIHTGENLTREFAVYGGSGTKYDFSDVIFPGDRRNCDKCHINDSQQLPLPEGLPMVNNPRAPVNPIGPTAAACTGCHTSTAAYAHAQAMTTPVGESCAVCHGRNADFSVNRVHAR